MLLFLIAVLAVPLMLLLGRLTTWMLVRRMDPRPGYIDHRRPR